MIEMVLLDWISTGFTLSPFSARAVRASTIAWMLAFPPRKGTAKLNTTSLAAASEVSSGMSSVVPITTAIPRGASFACWSSVRTRAVIDEGGCDLRRSTRTVPSSSSSIKICYRTE